MDFCLSQFNNNNEVSCDDLLLDDIDCLENLNENDFLNFTNGCDDLQYSSLLPDTPPETPINYQSPYSNGTVNDSPPRSASNSFTLPSPESNLSSLLESGSYSPSSNSSCSSSSSQLNFAIGHSPQTNLNNNSQQQHQQNQLNQTIISHPALIIPQSNNGVGTLTACLNSPSSIVIPSIVNCQPVLASVDLNGYTYQLNGNSLVYTKSIEGSNSLKSKGAYIQPKPILPSQQISPKLANNGVQQKELSKSQTLEARKLRNREAALNSRMKKKEYVEGLEENVKSLTKERDDLREENKQLKMKVADLESKLYVNKRPMDINGNYGAVSKKAKMSYFAVCVMLCLQVSPYLIPGGSDHELNTLPASRQLAAMPIQHTGRSLLWKRDTDSANELGDYDMDDSKSLDPSLNSKESLNSSVVQYANMTSKSVLCKDYILMNRTESMRLESELRDWFTRFQLEEKQQLLMYRQQLRRNRLSKMAAAMPKIEPATKKTGTGNKRLLFDSKYVPIPRLKLWMQKQNGDYDLSEHFDSGSDGTPVGGTAAAGDTNKEEKGGSAGIESLFGLDYQSLLRTIHRRDDTFYYLSYPSKGHLILPPISNRSDVRPRFSFLIPTFHNLSLDNPSAGGQTAHQNLNMSANPQMFILQIDCQVINTKVTLINEDGTRFANKTSKPTADQPKRYPRSTVVNNGTKSSRRNGNK